MHDAAGRRVGRLKRKAVAICLGALVGASSACAPEAPRPSILLITVDTLRADALDLPQRAGEGASRTPRLAALAAEGTVFERATAPMALTRPAHFSILTGRYPREHGVVNNQLALPEGSRPVSVWLRDAGYATGGFVAVSLLGRGSGSEQGFEAFVAPERELEWRASQVVDETLAWLEARDPAVPFFAWVHLFDPHQPYDPPADLRSQIDPSLAKQYPVLGWQQFLEIARQSGGQISHEIARHARALYEAEVLGIDREVGRLLDAVATLPGETAVVFTADHGECFENGVWFEHSDCLFEGGVRVPLVVRYPPTFAPGARVDALVSNADVAPTLLQIAGLDPPDEMSVPALDSASTRNGREVLLQNPFYPAGVLPARRHRQVVIRRVAGESVAPFEAGSPKLGLVRGDWKYLRGERGDELYAVGVGSAREENVAYRERSVRDEMSEALDAALERHGAATIEAEELNPELQQSLRALGYIE